MYSLKWEQGTRNMHTHCERSHRGWEGVGDLCVQCSLAFVLEFHHEHVLKQLVVLGLCVIEIR